MFTTIVFKKKRYIQSNTRMHMFRVKYVCSHTPTGVDTPLNMIYIPLDIRYMLTGFSNFIENPCNI